jgi:hypothetical protein
MERTGCAQKQQANPVVLQIPVPLQDGQEGPAVCPPLRARRLCGGDQHLRLKHDQSCHSFNAVWIHVGGMRSRNLIQALSDDSLCQDINHRFVIPFRNTASRSVDLIYGTAVMVAYMVSNLTPPPPTRTQQILKSCSRDAAESRFPIGVYGYIRLDCMVRPERRQSQRHQQRGGRLVGPTEQPASERGFRHLWFRRVRQ